MNKGDLTRENADEVIKEIEDRERRSKRLAPLLTIIPLVLGLALLGYSIYHIRQAQQKVISLRAESIHVRVEADSFRRMRDTIRMEYLKAKGFNFSNKKSLLAESIRADELLTRLLATDTPSTAMHIAYYRKSLDQQKIWLALKEIGYINITESQTKNDPVLLKAETNAIGYSKDVRLVDIKVIALTLIRAGVRMQHIFPLQNHAEVPNYIQIISEVPADGTPDQGRALMADEVANASSIGALIIP